MTKRFFLIIVFVFSSAAISIAYDTYSVHPLINENALLQTKVDSYLKNQLGLRKGITEILQQHEIKEWLRKGAEQEDVPFYRANNHFHDPLQPWDQAGLKGSTFSISSIVWSQFQGPQSGGDWSWAKAREFYYNALTRNLTPVRERYFADTFRALGQIMHLLADSSVPAHVRNDIHVFPFELPGITFGKKWFTYETWAKDNAGTPFFKGLLKGLNVNPSIFTQAIANPSTPVPISALWDQNKYTVGSNIGDIVGTNIGLAEYTNANFFSEDTIFKNYPHPAYTDTTFLNIDWSHPETIDAEDGQLDSRIYIRKTVGEADPRLAALSYISYDCINKGRYDFSPLILDEKVYRDYAAMLIPRAVGYSAALLDYFFRGSIDIVPPGEGVYAGMDNTQAGFSRITLRARNTTEGGDAMPDGSIELVIRYKLHTGSPFSNDPVGTSDDFTYIVIPELNNIRAIPRDTYTDLVFGTGQDVLIPLNAVDLTLQVVYHGRLGNEDGAVAVGFRDISEPTPIDFFSNLDRICINGSWYVAGSSSAISQVDMNHDGIANEWDVYAHDVDQLYLKISDTDNPLQASPAQYDYIFSSPSTAALSRLIYVLADHTAKFTYSFHITRTRKDPQDYWNHLPSLQAYTGTPVVNQDYYVEDQNLCGGPTACYIRYVPSFYPMRGYLMWWGSGFIFMNKPYPELSRCDYQLIP